MALYENTIVLKQDLAEKELDNIRQKYQKLIAEFSGKLLKIEDWGMIELSNKIKNSVIEPFASEKVIIFLST